MVISNGLTSYVEVIMKKTINNGITKKRERLGTDLENFFYFYFYFYGKALI